MYSTLDRTHSVLVHLCVSRVHIAIFTDPSSLPVILFPKWFRQRYGRDNAAIADAAISARTLSLCDTTNDGILEAIHGVMACRFVQAHQSCLILMENFLIILALFALNYICI